MDYEQWRCSHHKQSDQAPDSAALSLFAPETNKNSTPTTATIPATLAQWQELELQALIYKYMMAGASVPLELILPLKRNLLDASAYYHHSQQYQHLQPSMLQSGYWGKYAIDPEPGRCRRTDGKKWRCSRDVVAGQKYCERHVHRGRNRSRKLVEVSKPIPDTGLKATALLPSLAMTEDSHFIESETLPLNLSSWKPSLRLLPEVVHRKWQQQWQ